VELRQLRYFLTVAKEQNFTRAAEKLHIAQPPLSRQIQQLEEELGVALFERGSRPVRLTDPGRVLFNQAAHVLESVDEIKGMAQRLREAERPRLGVGFVPSTLYAKLPDVIRRYRAARPRVELVLLELTTLEQIAALKEGRIDVGFGRITFDDPAIERILLRNERLVVALPSSHPWAGRRGPIPLAQMATEPLIIYPKAPRPSYADQVLELFRGRNLRPPLIHEVKELQTALGLVAAETGLCIVPASVEQLRRNNVVYRPINDPAAMSPIIMSTRKDDHSPEIALILRTIHDIYKDEGVVFGR
jgi:DNA-binding transcriptional LysR family regulator